MSPLNPSTDQRKRAPHYINHFHKFTGTSDTEEPRMKPPKKPEKRSQTKRGPAVKNGRYPSSALTTTKNNLVMSCEEEYIAKALVWPRVRITSHSIDSNKKKSKKARNTNDHVKKIVSCKSSSSQFEFAKNMDHRQSHHRQKIPPWHFVGVYPRSEEATANKETKPDPAIISSLPARGHHHAAGLSALASSLLPGALANCAAKCLERFIPVQELED
nr:hypothetical protein Iba_chr12bCG17080 [Ipomoea batatas]